MKDTQDIAHIKQELRTHLKEVRASISAPLHAEKSRIVCQHLVEDIASHTRSGSYVAAFSPLGSELDISAALKACFALDRKLCLPALVRPTACEQAQMHFYPISEDMWANKAAPFLTHPARALNATDIYPMQLEACKHEHIDYLICPLLGFDAGCYRIGYGGGYYDRALADCAGRKVGVAFSEQFCACLPLEAHDQPLDLVLHA